MFRRIAYAVAAALLLANGVVMAQDPSAKAPQERRQSVALSDAVLQALERNLDISISRTTKNSRLSEIVGEEAKFDPTLSLNGQYNRQVQPLNRPVFGGTNQNLNQILTFDQRSHSLTA
ncbi:MAG: TolC family protein, partial [Nitrospira sp.]